MKILVALALWLFSSFVIPHSSFASPCPITGDARDARLAALDKLKNRSGKPLPIDPKITITAMLAPGNDTNRFSQDKAASITGWVAEIKPGGLESCNCHAPELAYRDTHIALVDDPKYFGNARRYVIVEITPRTRAGALAAVNLRKLLHQRVTVTGDMFFDAEHTQNAENTNPGGKNNWRATCWELHPVFKIEPQFKEQW
jgi:hypothetical protein